MDSLFEIPGLARFLLGLAALGTALWTLVAVARVKPDLPGRRTLICAVVLLLVQKLGGVVTAFIYSLLAPGSMADSDKVYQILSWFEIGGIGLAIVGLMLLGRGMSRSGPVGA
jgi:hypothetical protein